MAAWYAHVCWTARPSTTAPTASATVDAELLDRLQASISELRDPGGPAYVLDPQVTGEWHAGFVVAAESIEDAAAAAAATLRTVVLDVGLVDPQLSRLDVLSEARLQEWSLTPDRLR